MISVTVSDSAPPATLFDALLGGQPDQLHQVAGRPPPRRPISPVSLLSGPISSSSELEWCSLSLGPVLAEFPPVVLPLRCLGSGCAHRPLCDRACPTPAFPLYSHVQPIVRCDDSSPKCSVIQPRLTERRRGYCRSSNVTFGMGRPIKSTKMRDQERTREADVVGLRESCVRLPAPVSVPLLMGQGPAGLLPLCLEKGVMRGRTGQGADTLPHCILGEVNEPAVGTGTMRIRYQTVGLIHILEQCLNRMQTMGLIHILEQCLNRMQTVGLIHTLEQFLNRMQSSI
ncbi:hypothetical protein AAFF_G00253220 [Aldrovandia affinis]|uniref:Uncharacterized protein n=1 Tax=Aldrovandia affinis TaxID=143900 RepID=A0AAD7WTI4_9TELE|nr:hypothetical protein AAFF_G00253220 [Aldrovandia affinis]